MTEVKTELASLEEHDNAVWKAVERRAYALYELDGFTDGHDQEHWLRAEAELTAHGASLSIESDAITVRMAIEDFPSAFVVSISARSLLILGLKDGSSNGSGGNNRDLLRVISLPLKVDSAQVTCELDDRDLALRLPLVAEVASKSACV